jgi:hypothetical protein
VSGYVACRSTADKCVGGGKEDQSKEVDKFEILCGDCRPASRGSYSMASNFNHLDAMSLSGRHSRNRLRLRTVWDSILEVGSIRYYNPYELLLLHCSASRVQVNGTPIRSSSPQHPPRPSQPHSALSALDSILRWGCCSPHCPHPGHWDFEHASRRGCASCCLPSSSSHHQ